MEQNEQAFHSKILLFGEYSIIQESMGLSVPYKNFEGQLTFSPTENIDPNFTEKSNEHLLNFSNYLKEKLVNKELEIDFDLSAFQKDIENGIFFESNIPQGFGVGSSGALVAAVYHRYALNKIDLENDKRKHFVAKIYFGQDGILFSWFKFRRRSFNLLLEFTSFDYFKK